MKTPYVDADFAPWSGPGTATLHGQAFLKTVGGDVKTCAGEAVFLIPGNPYDDELVTAKGSGLANGDARVRSHFRETICDAQGNFAFEAVPAQRWYVATMVTWNTPHIYAPGEQPEPQTSFLFGGTIPAAPALDQQGGGLLQSVTLQPGTNQVILTDRDLK